MPVIEILDGADSVLADPVLADPVLTDPVLADSALANPMLADYSHITDVALRRSRSGEHGLYIAESALVLERALAVGHRVRSVLCLETYVAAAVALVGPDVPVFWGSPSAIERLTGYMLHRGLIASLHRPALPSVASVVASARRVVILEDVVDPTNVGAIFRSVAAIGADAVLVTPSCSDPFYRRAIRVSMGAVLQVPWTRTGDWPELGRELAGFEIAALALAPDAVSLREFASRVPHRVALVLGAEGAGLSAAALATAHTVVRIPMAHSIDSLNVAATAAVAMYALADGD